jgi:hypothetical protein
MASSWNSIAQRLEARRANHYAPSSLWGADREVVMTIGSHQATEMCEKSPDIARSITLVK